MDGRYDSARIIQSAKGRFYMKPIEYYKHRNIIVPSHVEEAYKIIRDWEKVVSNNPEGSKD